MQSPDAPWRTIETPHYRIHYPASSAGGFEPFAREVASRAEGVHRAVVEAVGFEAPGPVDVLLRDPVADANGMAVPLLKRPFVELWKTPPESDSAIGHHRGWVELLVVHELTHVHHLARPQEDPGFVERLQLLPAGPLALKAPRWVSEGYATLVEGRITGSGRPSSPYRAAVLRTWALAGKLPSYDGVSRSEGYRGGGMAYLVGSAFLEWLERRSPDRPDVLKQFWKQLASRKRRSFDKSFEATFGAAPRELYDRWRAETGYEAVAFERRLKAAGLVEGEPWARLRGDVTDLSVSADGARLLARVLVPGDPGLRLFDLPDGKGKREDAARKKEKKSSKKDGKRPGDPVDVPPLFEEREAAESLPRIDGSVPSRPLFAPDGRVLFDLKELDGEGVLVRRPWAWTPGKGIDRLPAAVSERTKVVRDGERWIAEGGGVAVALPFEPVGAVRFDARGEFVYGATAVDGIWNVVRAPIRREGGAKDGGAGFAAGSLEVLTRTVSAAWNPAPAPDGKVLYFTRQAAVGTEIRRLSLERGALAAARLPAGDEPLVPATVLPPPESRDLLPPPVEPPAPRPYSALAEMRAGSRSGLSITPSGTSWQVGAGGNDLVGRLGWLALAGFGDPAGPRGAAAAVRWAGWRWAPELQLFSSLERPSDQRFVAPQGLDRQRGGGELSFSYREEGRTPFEIRPHVAAERVENVDGTVPSFSRVLAGVSLSVSRSVSRGEWGAEGRFDATGQAGGSGGESWQLGRASLRLTALTPAGPVGVRAEAGRTWGSPSAWDLLSVGGVSTALVPAGLDASRYAQAALPAFLVTGDRLLAWRLQWGSGIRAYLEQAVAWTGDGGRPPMQRVAGVELSVSELLPAAAAIPLVGRFSMTAGVHRTLDGEMRGRTVATVVFVPRP